MRKIKKGEDFNCVEKEKKSTEEVMVGATK